MIVIPEERDITVLFPDDVRKVAYYSYVVERAVVGEPAKSPLDEPDFLDVLMSGTDLTQAFISEAFALLEDLEGFYNTGKPVKLPKLSDYLLSCRLYHNHRDVCPVCPLDKIGVLDNEDKVAFCANRGQDDCYMDFTPPIFKEAIVMPTLFQALSVKPEAMFFLMDARASREYQLSLWLDNVSVHNPVTNECCPDFSCCLPAQTDTTNFVFPETPFEEKLAFCEAFMNDDTDTMTDMCIKFFNNISKSLSPNSIKVVTSPEPKK